MNSTVETLDDNRVKLSVEVDEAELDTAIDAAFKRIAREVRMPGFRPGRAPRRLLEAQLGHQVGRDEALRTALPDYYARAVVEHDVDVIASPDIEITGGQESGPLTFAAVVEIRPAVRAAGYNGLRVEIPSPIVPDAEVDRQIDRLRDQFAELAPVDRPATDSDHVTIDIRGTLDGEELPGLTSSDYDYEVGTGAVVEEIDATLRGAKPGDILEFDADHPDPDETGTLHFRILVKDVKEKVLPDLDDDFVAANSEFETVDRLREDTHRHLSTLRIARSRLALQSSTAEALAELVDEEVPEAMVQTEINARLHDLAHRLERQKTDLQSYLASTGKTVEELTAELREPAARSVRIDLGLRAVAEAEDLWPDDDKVDEALLELIDPDARGEVAEVRERLAGSGQLSGLRADLAKQAALEWLMDNVEVVDEEGAAVDRGLLEFPEDAADDDDSTDEGSADDDAADNDAPDDEDERVTSETTTEPSPEADDSEAEGESD